MTSPLHAAYYADQAVQETVEIVENTRLAKDTFRLRFHCPPIARRILPGQFLMLRLSGLNDPLIGRPLAMYDTSLSAAGEPQCVDVVYLVKGKFTSRLQACGPGQRLDVWGPLGNGFLPRPIEHLVMVAGGIGQTPFLALAQESLGRKQFGVPGQSALRAARTAPRAAQVTFCYGARTADYLAGVADFERLGVQVRITTDDGSAGRRGLVTELLADVLLESAGRATHIVCCGPEPMMEAVARLAQARQISCEVSLETPMACGIGVCFTCVAKIRGADGEWDYQRTCVAGPVFDANCIKW